MVLLLSTWDHGYSCNQLLFLINMGCYQHSAEQSMSPAKFHNKNKINANHITSSYSYAITWMLGIRSRENRQYIYILKKQKTEEIHHERTKAKNAIILILAKKILDTIVPLWLVNHSPSMYWRNIARDSNTQKPLLEQK